MRNLLAGAVVLGLSGTAAHGQEFEQNLIAQLQLQGYAQIQVERTLLGRVRILAMQNGVMREIVLNPRTGEVLRDVWLAGADGATPNLRAQSGTGGGAGSSASSGGTSGGAGSGNSGSGSSDDESGDDDSGDDDKSDDGDSDGDNSDDTDSDGDSDDSDGDSGDDDGDGGED